MEAALLSGGISNPAIYSAALRAAEKHKPDPSTILDFGAGIGQLTKALEKWRPSAAVSGADIMAKPADFGQAWHQADLNAVLPIESESFDLIFCVEVIEHLENPRHTLREIHRMLRPGGVAVVTTPHTHSMRSLMTMSMRGHFAAFDDENYPAHITAVAPIDLLRASRETGFETADFFYTGSGMIPKLLRWRWQQIPLVGGSLKGPLFSDNYGAALTKRV